MAENEIHANIITNLNSNIERLYFKKEYRYQPLIYYKAKQP